MEQFPTGGFHVSILSPVDLWDGLLKYGTEPIHDYESDSQDCGNVVPREECHVLRSPHCCPVCASIGRQKHVLQYQGIRVISSLRAVQDVRSKMTRTATIFPPQARLRGAYIEEQNHLTLYCELTVGVLPPGIIYCLIGLSKKRHSNTISSQFSGQGLRLNDFYHRGKATA